MVHEEALRRILPELKAMLTGPDTTVDIRICSIHPFETKKESKPATIYFKDGTIKEQSNELSLTSVEYWSSRSVFRYPDLFYSPV
jgi:hypothetical protein